MRNFSSALAKGKSSSPGGKSDSMLLAVEQEKLFSAFSVCRYHFVAMLCVRDATEIFHFVSM